MWKKAVVAYSKEQAEHSPKRTKEKHKLSVGIAGILSESRSHDLQNIKLQYWSLNRKFQLLLKGTGWLLVDLTNTMGQTDKRNLAIIYTYISINFQIS